MGESIEINKNKGIFLLLAVFCIIVVLYPVKVLGAYPEISAKETMTAYPWQNKAVHVYDNEELTGIAVSAEWQKCQVIKIGEDAVQIEYKDGKNKLQGWVSLSKFVHNTGYTHIVAYANRSIPLYQRPSASSKSYVNISQYSAGLVVSEKNNWIQVIFQSKNQYYLGWMKRSRYKAHVRVIMETSDQALADGSYTIAAKKDLKKQIEFREERADYVLAAKKNKKEQQFKLRHVKGKYYLISPEGKDNLYLNADGEVSTTMQKWYLKRQGGYFYLRLVKGQQALGYSSGVIQTLPYTESAGKLWVLTKVKESPKKKEAVVFSQFDSRWGGITYKNGSAGRRTISSSGCGVLALTNAVYALNGQFIPPKTLAKYSASKGHYIYNQGTDDTLYPAAAKKYGKTYQFKHSGKVNTFTKLKKHLKKGGTAVALVPGHYVAIVGYRASDQKYLVLDSAVYGKRPTSINGDWLSAAVLRKGVMKCEYFHLFSRN